MTEGPSTLPHMLHYNLDSDKGLEKLIERNIVNGAIPSMARSDMNLSQIFVPKDAVDKPPHYNFGNIECIDYLKDNMTPEAFRGYLEGNTKKYMHRFRYKGKQLEDLKKAQWYLNYLIKEVEENANTGLLSL